MSERSASAYIDEIFFLLLLVVQKKKSVAASFFFFSQLTFFCFLKLVVSCLEGTISGRTVMYMYVVGQSETQVKLVSTRRLILNFFQKLQGFSAVKCYFSQSRFDIGAGCSKTGFSLRILVAGERCNCTGEYCERDSMSEQKIAIGYCSLGGELGVVNREFSDLRCSMNTLQKLCPVVRDRQKFSLDV